MGNSINLHSVYCRNRYQNPNDDYREKSLESKRRCREKQKKKGFVPWKQRQENKERTNLIARRFRRRLRLQVLIHYSGNPPKCAHCGMKDIRVLSIDHINGDGGKQRKEIGKSGHPFYQWLKTNDFPEGYQVLCRNCNWIKRIEEGGENGI